MQDDDRYPPGIESLRSRLSRLSRASLRIAEDLGLDTALQEVADEARSLTCARYTVVATLGKSMPRRYDLRTALPATQVTH